MFKTTTTLAQAISMAAAAPMTADYGYEKAVAVLASENLKFVPRSDIPEDADLEGTHLIKLIADQGAVHAWLDVEIYESEFLRPWIQIYRTATEYTPEQLLNVQKLLIALSAEFDIYSQKYEFDIVRKMFQPFLKREMDGMYRIEKGSMEPAGEQFKVHALAGRAGAEVYDQTQTDSTMKDGDLLDLGGGNIGILLQAWPTVVCGEIDQFHKLADGVSFDSYLEGKYSAAALKAREIAALALQNATPANAASGI